MNSNVYVSTKINGKTKENALSIFFLIKENADVFIVKIAVLATLNSSVLSLLSTKVRKNIFFLISKAPVEIRNSFDALIENLCPNNPPDIEKARVFFNWIAHQKLETIAWGKPEENTPLYLLWQLKNQYISYTTVYLELCR